MPVITSREGRSAPGSTPVLDRVPRELVHKLAESEVLLTGCRTVAPDTFLVTARRPAHHAFYGPVNGLSDPLFAAESIRQAVPLLSHVAYDVPFGHRQSWDHYRQTLLPAALTDGATAADTELRISCTDVVRRAGRLASLTMRVGLVRDGLPLGTAELAFHNHPPAVYRRLRGRYADLERATAQAVPPAHPMTPGEVARRRSADVVLAATGEPGRSRLRVDLSHPVLFDHPVDHVPGMLLLEAARQAAHRAAHPEPMVVTGLEAEFRRYVELDAPCWIETTREPAGATGQGATGQGATGQRVRVTAVQRDETLFTSVVTLTPAW
ncbi:ScbA/BarX family gamma-butyrolactone biosynthesis protein [Streptomyces sp. NPDC006184]|uniref:ScbA/BarX family gamma-butyrolactone biosynthesis protein n=1 Tax=Streptomyces sp. NPDC006184 TaxID=3155455 RepID=UPI0033B6E1AD